MLRVAIADAVGTLTLDRPDKRNALCEAMVEQISAAFARFRAAGVRCAVLRAQPGCAVWSAGHDIAEMPESGIDPLAWRDPLRKLVREIETFPAPVVAMIEGSVWGGACETVFACDLIVAAAGATFAATPAKHSVPYNVTGLLTFLNAASLHLAKEMLFTAAPSAPSACTTSASSTTSCRPPSWKNAPTPSPDRSPATRRCRFR